MRWTRRRRAVGRGRERRQGGADPLAQYGGVRGARYEQVIGEIERRLDGCALIG